MSFHPSTRLAAGLLGSIAFLSVTLAASEIITDTAPPPLRAEHAPPPRDGYVWGPGHWEWNRHSYVWVSGTWIVERRASRWVADRWEPAGTQWRYIPGHWERQS
jgi:hypothetical protein